MNLIKEYSLFKESENKKQLLISSKNIIRDICVGMLLINNNFLDKLLDMGLKARYQENSQVFINDLKNLLFGRNKLKIGKFESGKCVEYTDQFEFNGLFESIDFDIEKDWNSLIGFRNTARNICDKLLPDNKLSEDNVVYVFLNIFKEDDNKEDIVLELTDGRQYGFYLNKNLSASKSASFNSFMIDLVGDDVDKFKSEEYLPKWNKLVQEWVKIIYENANKNIQAHIEKFIEVDRIESLNYFKFFELKHRDPRFKHLGEYISEVDKNILWFSDLLGMVWKNRDKCFFEPDKVYKKWMETKVFILNSRILEHFLTSSLVKNNLKEIKKLKSGYKLALSKLKMKLVKSLVEKMGCTEKTTYYLSNNGNNFIQVPSRQFFRENFKDFRVKFDYHVKLVVSDYEENNDFKIDIQIYMDKEMLMGLNIIVKFTSHEMSDKLTAKYVFDIPDNFNYKVSSKQ